MLAIMGAPPGAGPARRDEVLRALTLDPDNPTSVIACIGRAREGARTVRDVISAEMWEAVNTTNLTLVDGDLARRPADGARTAVYGYVKERCALFWGLTSRTMLRDEASAFLAAGGRIESADMVLRMLRVALPTDVSEAVEHVGDRPGAGAAAGRRRLPGLPPRGAGAAQRAARSRASCSSSAPTPTRSRPRSTPCTTRSARADGNPRNSEPVLRLQRLSADLEFRGRAEADGGDLHATCEAVQEELVRVDRDIADRYFAGAVGTMVVA